MKLTRRRFFGIGAGAVIAAIALAPKTPREPIPPETIAKVQPVKRLGSFEESAKAFIEWLKTNNFDRTALDKFQKFKDALPFEFDSSINSAIKDILADKIKGGTLKKDNFIFEFGSAEGKFSVIFGKIIKHTKIRRHNVYLLDGASGSREADVGSHAPITGNIFLYDREMKYMATRSIDELFLTWQKILRMPESVLEQRKNEILAIADKEPFDSTDLRSFAQQLSIEFKNPTTAIHLFLASIKLALFDMKNYDGFRKPEDKQRAIKQFVFNALVHELMHGEIHRFGNKVQGNLPMYIQENLCHLTMLAYGERQYNTLSLMISTEVYEQVSRKAPKSDLSFIWQFLAQVFMPGSTHTEKEIQEVSLDFLSNYAYPIFLNNHVGDVVDISLFDQARKFVEGIN